MGQLAQFDDGSVEPSVEYDADGREWKLSSTGRWVESAQSAKRHRLKLESEKRKQSLGVAGPGTRHWYSCGCYMCRPAHHNEDCTCYHCFEEQERKKNLARWTEHEVLKTVREMEVRNIKIPDAANERLQMLMRQKLVSRRDPWKATRMGTPRLHLTHKGEALLRELNSGGTDV